MTDAGIDDLQHFVMLNRFVAAEFTTPVFDQIADQFHLKSRVVDAWPDDEVLAFCNIVEFFQIEADGIALAEIAITAPLAEQVAFFTERGNADMPLVDAWQIASYVIEHAFYGWVLYLAGLLLQFPFEQFEGEKNLVFVIEKMNLGSPHFTAGNYAKNALLGRIMKNAVGWLQRKNGLIEIFFEFIEHGWSLCGFPELGLFCHLYPVFVYRKT